MEDKNWGMGPDDLEKATNYAPRLYALSNRHVPLNALRLNYRQR